MRWRGEVRQLDLGVKDDVLDMGDSERRVNLVSLLVLSFVSLIWGMLVLSQDFTGYVIMPRSMFNGNFFGISLFVASTVGFFIYVREKIKRGLI